MRIHQIVIDRFSHIQGREGGLFERRLEHTAHCIFAGKGIGHTCQSNHREPTTTFLFAISLIYARVIISEYSLGHRYIDMFMTSSIDWIKNTQQVHFSL